MSFGEILTAIELAKKAVPALDVLKSGIAELAGHEKDDVRNAAVALGKTIYDLKDGFLALEAAVKAGLKG